MLGFCPEIVHLAPAPASLTVLSFHILAFSSPSPPALLFFFSILLPHRHACVDLHEVVTSDWHS